LTLPRRRPDLDGLATYSSVSPGPVPIVLRASSNEAPGPIDPAIGAAVARSVTHAGRYPLIGGQDLIDRLAAALEVPSDTIAVGDGSLSLLDRTMWTFLQPGDEVVMAWRSYEAYPTSVRVAGGRPVQVPLDRAGCHDLEAMLAAVTARTRMVIVCNPNNPTGTTVDWSRLVAFLDGLPDDVLVVLDEAYTEYDERPRDARMSLPSLIRRGNVVVLRTFSKAYGLAGLRVGYLVSAPEVVAAVRSVLPPFPVSSAGTAAAVAALDHHGGMKRRVEHTRRERNSVGRLLEDHGMRVPVSRSNFVWLPLAAHSSDFTQLCRDRGLGVRAFPGEGVRITVGDTRLAKVLGQVLQDWSASPVAQGLRL